MYALSCATCNKCYVGQTSRSLKLRYNEHKGYLKRNDPQSAYALHILNDRHEYGPMYSIMTLLKPIQHTSLLIPFERIFIHSLYKADNLISEQSPGDPNPLLIAAIEPSLPRLPYNRPD
jgi:hypothetical protein